MLVTTKEQDNLDPRVKRTRQSLAKAFVGLLEEKGFQAITVQDIAGRAGVNRATFYSHFEDKYDLLDQGIRQGFIEEIDKRMLNACHYTPANLQNLIVAVCEFTQGINSHCKPPQAQFESLIETQVKAVVHELLVKWVEGLKVDVSPETAATAASWAIYGLASQWSHSNQPKPAAEFALEVLPLVAANLKLTPTDLA